MPRQVVMTAEKADLFFARLNGSLEEGAILNLLDIECLTARGRVEAAAIIREVVLESETERRSRAKQAKAAGQEGV